MERGERGREGERRCLTSADGGSAWLHGLVHAGCALALYSSHVGTVDLCGGCWFTVTQITADLSKAPASVFIDGGGIPNIIMTCNKLLALEHRCGKSTLFALALRFYTPARGRILLDGADLLRVDERSLRLAGTQYAVYLLY